MKRNLTRFAGFLFCAYGQRWQAECGISMIKRRLGTAVAARSEAAQSREGVDSLRHLEFSTEQI